MEPFSLFEDSFQCCYLCHDGQKIFQLLTEHFKTFHFDGEKFAGCLVTFCSIPQ